MNRFLLLLLLSWFFIAETAAQQAPAVKDSLVQKDSVKKKQAQPQRTNVLPQQVSDLPGKKDSLPKQLDSLPVGKDSLGAKLDSTQQKQVKTIVRVDHSTTPYYKVLKEHPLFNFSGKGVFRTISPRQEIGKEGVFYLLMFLFLLLAIIRALFDRYFQNLFTVFFRASMKQKQIREQLLQAPLASLLLNLLFIGTAGLLVTMALQNKVQGVGGPVPFWWLYLYSNCALAILYLGKYFLLKMCGWTLKMEQTTDTYIFIVFMCNKVLAIMLLPLLLLVAFGSPDLSLVAITICYVLVAGIFAYRYISSYGYINREVRTSRFHFFLYLCAFEVAPLLLIYKVLLKFV